MRDNVVSLPTALNADAAWARYQSFAQRLLDNPRLVVDRGFMEQLHMADAAFKSALERMPRRA